MEPTTLALGLARFAPLAAKWLWGEKGAEAAEEVVKIAEAVTGREGVDAQKAIAKDPQLALEFQKALLEHQSRLDALFFDDRRDARARDIEIQKSRGHNRRADIMAYGACFTFFALIFSMLFVNMPDGGITRDVTLILFGNLSTIVGAIYAFEFGSSRESQRKE